MTFKQTVRFLSGAIFALLLVPAVALAAQTSSPHYQVNEVFFGSGGELSSCSTNYCSKQSAGEVVNGKTSSPNYVAQGGFNTNRAPFIEFIVSNTTVDLGTLTTASTKTANATFTVKSYLSHGYSVVNASNPPTNTSYTMNALSVPTASSAGTEQFGMNLVANTQPATFGADPTQAPDNSFGFGVVAADYNSTNLYKYIKGDTVAYSSASTSRTNYTLSYIFNVSNVTPGGTYNMRHVLVATATY
ncbi:MAG: hypothetical protein QFB86_03780 [Patescibacteria group bacterium]|nr:hypothetical protein [Patescibacteria group bacterium]